MMSDIINIFSNQTVVSVFCDSLNPDKHLTGWIFAYSENVVMIKHISPIGLYDGFILVQRDDIYRIDADGKYEKKIYNLYKAKKQEHPHFLIDEDLYTSLLVFCKKQELIISIELADGILSGFVDAFDDECITMTLVDNYGDSNGQTIVMNSEIVSISVDTQNEQDIKLLYRLTHKTEDGSPF